MYRRLTFLLFVVSALTAVTAQEFYDSKYDTLDVDAILSSETERDRYYNCFMDTGPCDEGMKFFKGNFPEAFVTNCKKCTEWQKKAFDKISAWYSANQEAKWNAFVDKMLQDAKAQNVAAK